MCRGRALAAHGQTACSSHPNSGFDRFFKVLNVICLLFSVRTLPLGSVGGVNKQSERTKLFPDIYCLIFSLSQVPFKYNILHAFKTHAIISLLIISSVGLWLSWDSVSHFAFPWLLKVCVCMSVCVYISPHTHKQIFVCTFCLQKPSFLP